jgi:hypothetical protein
MIRQPQGVRPTEVQRHSLAALSSLRIAPDDLGTTVRATLGQPLRREGTLARLCVSGIVSCIGNSDLTPDAGRTALIWGSTGGARVEIDRMLDEICRHDSLPMPFDFIASQCGVAAVYAARFVANLQCGLYLPSGGNIWQQMLSLATCWLEEGRYDRVLCGWVDQASPDAIGQLHASDWLLLADPAYAGLSLAHVRTGAGAASSTSQVADAEFIPALRRWLDADSPAGLAVSAIYPVEFQRG